MDEFHKMAPDGWHKKQDAGFPDKGSLVLKLAYNLIYAYFYTFHI